MTINTEKQPDHNHRHQGPLLEILSTHPYWNDVTWAVHYRKPCIHQHLSHELHVAMVLAPQYLSLSTLQSSDRFEGTSQEHGWQGCCENEASSIRTDSVYQSTCTGDVSSHTAKGFA